MNMRILTLMTTVIALALLGCKEHETQVLYWNNNTDKPKEVFQIDKETGKKDGFYKAYLGDGKTIDVETAYMDGELNGSYKEYYGNGNLKIDATYNKGKKNGLYREFYDDGSLMMKSSYKEGLFDDTLKLIDERKVLRLELFLKEGKLLSAKEFYKDGNIKEECVVKDNMNIKEHKLCYDPCEARDIQSLSSIMNKNSLNASCKEFNEEGELVFKCTYNNGKHSCTHED